MNSFHRNGKLYRSLEQRKEVFLSRGKGVACVHFTEKISSTPTQGKTARARASLSLLFLSLLIGVSLFLSPYHHGSFPFFSPPAMAVTEQIGAIKEDKSKARYICSTESPSSSPPPSLCFPLPSTLDFGGQAGGDEDISQKKVAY
jgi:hypothetical protein